MKSKLLIAVSIITGWLSIGMSCQKPQSITGGGKGGNATLMITPVHFGLNVDSCTVYIKYGATEMPANNVYDDSGKCFKMDTIPVVVFAHLTKGQYYIFGDGYHKVYYAFVKGGISMTISNEDTIRYQLPTSQYYK